MYLVDTNVISAFMQPAQNNAAIDWLESTAREDLFTSTVTIFEVRMGLELMPAGRRRVFLTDGFQTLLQRHFDGRIVSFDAYAAQKAALAGALSRKDGRNVGTADTQIAGIALANDATLVTRNIKDFDGLGLRLVNPWD